MVVYSSSPQQRFQASEIQDCNNFIVVRGWRNWQTRTFEVRVVYPWGFKSPPSHQSRNLHGHWKIQCSCGFCICGLSNTIEYQPIFALACYPKVCKKSASFTGQICVNRLLNDTNRPGDVLTAILTGWYNVIRDSVGLCGSRHAGLVHFRGTLCTVLRDKAFGRSYCEGVWLQGSQGGENL